MAKKIFEKKECRWILAMTIIAAIAVLMGLLINSNAKLQNQKESALLDQKEWKVTRDYLQSAESCAKKRKQRIKFTC